MSWSFIVSSFVLKMLTLSDPKKGATIEANGSNMNEEKYKEDKSNFFLFIVEFICLFSFSFGILRVI